MPNPIQKQKSLRIKPYPFATALALLIVSLATALASTPSSAAEPPIKNFDDTAIHLYVVRRGLDIGPLPRFRSLAHSGVLLQTRGGEFYLLEYMSDSTAHLTLVTPRTISEHDGYIKIKMSGRGDRGTQEFEWTRQKAGVRLDGKQTVQQLQALMQQSMDGYSLIGSEQCHTAQERLRKALHVFEGQPNWDDWAEFRQVLVEHEGRIPHMYLDTVGKVTVGVGNMLPSVTEAQKLKFINRTSGNPATPEEIAADFQAVSQQPQGQVARSYKQHTKLDMAEAEMDALLDKRLNQFAAELKQHFPDFDDYPLLVQYALMDMAFNLGTTGLVQKFPKFCEAIRQRDWAEAANQSKRRGISDKRNAQIVGWLLQEG